MYYILIVGPRYSNLMIIWMLIEARRETGRVEGVLVFAKAPSSLAPKPRTKFFGNERPVPLIHLVYENRYRVATWSFGNQKTQFDSPKWIKGTGPSLPKNLVRGFGTREEGAFAKTKAPSTRPAL